jgi:hypothetical protein
MHTSVLTMSTGPPAQDQQNFVWTSKFVSFYLKLYKNKFKNFIRTSKFTFTFQELIQSYCSIANYHNLQRRLFFRIFSNFEDER